MLRKLSVINNRLQRKQSLKIMILYLNYLRGGPGFGDPLERKANLIEADLNEGHLLPRYAESVYGAVVNKDEKGKYTVDEKATNERRKQIKKDRLKRGVPVKQWMEQERQIITNKQAEVQVKHMYARSFALSLSFFNEFKEFWNLSDDWKLTEAELGVPVFGAKINHQKN